LSTTEGGRKRQIEIQNTENKTTERNREENSRAGNKRETKNTKETGKNEKKREPYHEVVIFGLFALWSRLLFGRRLDGAVTCRCSLHCASRGEDIV
jgi:hypothetical protein